MDRTHKENLLLLHADNHSTIVAALRERFPMASVWASLEGAAAASASPTTAAQAGYGRKRFITWLAAGVLIIAAIALGAAMSRHWPQPGSARAIGSRAAGPSDCGALALDDVFVVKDVGADAAELIQLDVRLRHTGAVAGAVNVSRVFVDCTERKEERSPVAVSATYDLLIRGDHNEAAIAQQLKSGEVDRILLRLGFTQESAAYQYTATLRLQYNGACVVESAPFTLSRDAAKHPALVAPWAGK
jgi:hypothetical protein